MTENVFRRLTPEELANDIANLKIFTKYCFDDRDVIWSLAINEYFKDKEEDKIRFLQEQEELKKEKKEKSEWFKKCKDGILEIYNNFCENRPITEEEKRFNEFSMNPEDRFNPKWYQNCIKVFMHEFNKMSHEHLYFIYDTSSDSFLFGNGFDAIKENLKKSGFNEKDIEEYTKKIQKRIISRGKHQKGSLCFTPYIDNKPVSGIILSPYRNPVDTLQTMWHETTHYIQKRDKRIMENEGMISLTEEEDKLKKQFSGKNEEKEYEKERKKLGFDAWDKKIRLLAEIQANLNGSMIVFLQALRSGLDEIQLNDVKRQLIRTAGVNYEGCYCDFVLTYNSLDRLQKDSVFRGQFLKDGNINYEGLYEYTYSEAKKTRDEILEFAKSSGVDCYELQSREDLMKKEDNPVYKIKTEEKKYYEKYPLTKQELLEYDIHCFRGSKEPSYHAYLCKKSNEVMEQQSKEIEQLTAQLQTLTPSKELY